MKLYKLLKWCNANKSTVILMLMQFWDCHGTTPQEGWCCSSRFALFCIKNLLKNVAYETTWRVIIFWCEWWWWTRAEHVCWQAGEAKQEIVPNRWYQAIVMNILKLIKICLLFALFMFLLSELKHYSDYLDSIKQTSMRVILFWFGKN